MSAANVLAETILRAAERIMPSAQRDWARAMAAELPHIPPGFDAISFAAGCYWAATLARATEFSRAVPSEVITGSIMGMFFIMHAILPESRSWPWVWPLAGGVVTAAASERARASVRCALVSGLKCGASAALPFSIIGVTFVLFYSSHIGIAPYTSLLLVARGAVGGMVLCALVSGISGTMMRAPLRMLRRVTLRDPKTNGAALLLVLTVMLATSCVSTTPSSQRPPPIAITNVHVIDMTGAAPGRPNMTVLISGDRITAVGLADEVDVPANATRINGDGKYLIPGLWDMHVHLTLTGPTVLPDVVAWGITTVRDVGSRFEETLALRNRVNAGEILGPRIYTSGPVLEGAAWMQAAYQIAGPDASIWAAAPRVIASKDNAQAVVDSLKRLGVDVVKSRNVYGDDFIAVAQAAQRAGMPHASHNPNRVNMAASARAGLDSFEHSESIWGDFDTMSVAARREMFTAVAREGAAVTPTLMTDVGMVDSPDSTILAAINDTLGLIDVRNRTLPAPMRAMWREAIEQRKKYGGHPPGSQQKIADFTREMNEAGILMFAGTDMGGIPMVYPGSGLHDELELLVTAAGFTPLQALATATCNPPRFFGRQEEIGTIAAGMIADLVLLDANPLTDIRNTRRIARVILRGRPVP